MDSIEKIKQEVTEFNRKVKDYNDSNKKTMMKANGKPNMQLFSKNQQLNDREAENQRKAQCDSKSQGKLQE